METTILAPTTLGSALTGASVGLLSHWAYFIHGEHHRGAARLAVVAVVLPAAVYGLQFALVKTDLLSLLKSTTIIVLAFWLSLWTSIIVYRVFFHRLRTFPGPPLAKVSKIQHMLSASKKNNFQYLAELHTKYGSFVRTGPNELSILHPDAINALYGARSNCNKAPWYDIGLPLVSLHTCRDRTAHDKRRRQWDQGFSTKALRDFEDRELVITRSLVDQFAARSGQPVNATHWFNYYSFDVMGELAFGKSFDMVKDGQMHRAIKMLHKAMEPYSFMATVPWLLTILSSLPGVGAEFNEFVEWCSNLVENRKKIEVESPDLMTYLINQKDPSEFDAEWLKGDARLIVVAGSDTTAGSLTHIFYHLAQNPQSVQKLREELTPLVPSLANFRAKDIADAPYLNGVINEALRLNHPVPSGLLRVTPPEGLKVGETYIPGGVTVSVPIQPMGRSEQCYAEPNAFIPERWSTQPELVKNKTAFSPFSTGRYSCIGKQLALIEMRSVVALVALQFDIAFAPGEDGTALMEKTVDAFTMALGDLSLVFTKI